MIFGGAEGVLATGLAHEADELAHMVLAALIVAAVVISFALDFAANLPV